jgi:hypothetical protein
MEAANWILEHWFDLFQTLGIVGGLLFTGFAILKDERARKISNMIAVKQQYRDIWEKLYWHPKLFRVLKDDVDLRNQPVTDEEWLFIKFNIFNLDTIYRSMKSGMFVHLEGLQKDVKEFYSLPIPQAVWEKIKPYQDAEFIEFVESALKK